MNITRFKRPATLAVLLSSALLAGGVLFHMSANAATAPAAAPAARPAAPAAPAAATAGPPIPRIIVIDRQAILRVSAAGKGMMASAQRLSQQADTEFKGQAEALQKELATVQRQLAILAPDVRAQKQKEFTTKQEAFQKRVTDRQAQIQNGFTTASAKLDQALGPILQQIMRERGANMLLDRAMVILSTADVDVSETAIQRLDKALPTLTVSLGRAAPAAAGAPAAPVQQ
jgi:Skp family chaperone for outer membrane proteins